MNIAIAGGGIMGQLTAYFMIEKGWKVTLFDPCDGMNCSHAAAGLLTPLAELEKCDWSICQMGLDALRVHWPAILKKLSGKIFFKAAGSVLISHFQDSADMHRFAEMITSKLKNNLDITLLNQQKLSDLEPELAKFSGGYHLHHEGQIDNQHLLAELKEYLLRCGAVWKKIKIDDFNCIRQTFDIIIDCRGLGAKTDLPQLRGIRGELVWLHAPEVHITRPVRLAHPRYGIYIVPRRDDIYLVGASEIEAEDYSEISVQTLLELLSAAYSVHSGFADARVLKTVTQCRPVLPHHRPQISIRSRVISINGLYRHGFLIAPALARDVVRFIENDDADLSYPEVWEQAA